jgi:hypothetical protein
MRPPLPVRWGLSRLTLIATARAAAPGWAVLRPLALLVLLVLLLVFAGSDLLASRTMRYSFQGQARDRAGRRGPSATDAMRGGVAPPQVTSAHVSDPYFNPALEALNLEYTLSKVSRVSIGLYDATGRRVRLIVLRGFRPAHVPLRVSWDGRDDNGKMVPAGPYSIYLRATDRLGIGCAAAPGRRGSRRGSSGAISCTPSWPRQPWPRRWRCRPRASPRRSDASASASGNASSRGRRDA